MSEKKFLAVISSTDRKHAYASRWFSTVPSAQHWADTYQTEKEYLVIIFEDDDKPVLEYIIQPK